jgi:hypothetical protein
MELLDNRVVLGIVLETATRVDDPGKPESI